MRKKTVFSQSLRQYPLLRRSAVTFLLVCLLSSLIVLSFMQNHHKVFAAGTAYYIDSSNGNDNNDGQSISTPWQTLSKVDSTTFQPGDHILFKAGDTWNGQLHPLGSGNSSNTITIDEYGSGNKPVINGNGAVADTVYLSNQQYWDINNLEVTNNSSSAALHTGVRVIAQDVAVASHIHISDLYIHNIKGYVNGYYGDNAGISVGVASSSAFPSSHWDDVLIQRNVITTVDRIGIFVGPSDNSGGVGRATNVVIQNNTISDSGGDAILTYITSGALVQYNVAHDNGGRAGQGCQSGYCNQCSADIWTANSDNGLFQYNEAYNDQNGCDGEGFDIDWGTSGTVFQYNYSHNNRGFLLDCRTCGTPGTDAIVRYNISQNDRGCVLCFAPGQLSSGSLQVYNNTFYVGAGLSTTIIYTYDGNPLGRSFSFTNNIIDNQGSGGYVSTPSAAYDHNLFFGNHPSSEPNDANKLTSDPLFVNPGSGAAGRNTLSGYQLQTGSPALGSGTLINGNGGQDFYGNAVSSSTPPNRGAYNGAGVSGVSTNYVANPGFETGDASSWNSYGGATVVANNVHSGTYAGQTGTNNSAFEQVVTGLSPNTTYTLSGWIKVANPGEGTYVGVKNFGGTETAFLVTTTNYSQGSVTFTMGANATTATIYCYKQSGSGPAFCDDFAVTYGTSSNQLVADPGYEQQTSRTLSTPWSSDLRDTSNCATGVDVGQGHAHSGNNNSWIYCNGQNQGGLWAAQAQYISVMPNTVYTLSVWVYNDTGTIGNTAKIEVASVPWSNPRNIQFTPSQTGYVQETLHFTTLSSETQISIEIGYLAPSGAATGMRVDDWSLTAG